MSHLDHLHFTAIEGVGVGAVMAFVTQSYLQLFVVPKAEVKKRRAQQYQVRLEEMEQLLIAQEVLVRKAQSWARVLAIVYGEDWAQQDPGLDRAMKSKKDEEAAALDQFEQHGIQLEELARAVERHNSLRLGQLAMARRRYWVAASEVTFRLAIMSGRDAFVAAEQREEVWSREQTTRSALRDEVTRLLELAPPRWRPGYRDGFKGWLRFKVWRGVTSWFKLRNVQREIVEEPALPSLPEGRHDDPDDFDRARQGGG